MLAILVVCSQASAAVSEDPSAKSVNAYGGAVIWTRTVASDDGFGGFRLTARGRDGVVRDLPIASFSHPVDADLGPDADGRLVAVYDRCRRGACDVYRYDFERRRERRLRAQTSRRRSESAISTWGGQHAFMRYAITIGFHYGYRRAGVYVGSSPFRVAARLVDGTDLRNGAIAYSTGTRYRPSATSRVHVVRFRGRHRRVCELAYETRVPRGPGAKVREAVLDGGYVYWLHTTIDGAGGQPTRVRRVRLPARNCRRRGPVEQSEELPFAAPDSLAVAGGRAFVTAAGGVLELPGLQFEAAG